jgi:hypothetical protein
MLVLPLLIIPDASAYAKSALPPVAVTIISASPFILVLPLLFIPYTDAGAASAPPPVAVTVIAASPFIPILPPLFIPYADADATAYASADAALPPVAVTVIAASPLVLVLPPLFIPYADAYEAVDAAPAVIVMGLLRIKLLKPGLLTPYMASGSASVLVIEIALVLLSVTSSLVTVYFVSVTAA